MSQSKEMFMQMREAEATESNIPVRRSIYNIGIDYLRLMDEIESNEGELTPEMEERLTINKAELETKAVGYGYVIRQFDDDLASIKNEIERLQRLAKSKEKAQDRLTETIKDAMLKYDITKIQQNNLTLSFRKSEKLIIEKTENIPAAYKSYQTVEKIDNAKLKADVKGGFVFDGISIQENQNLQIR